MSKPDPKTFDLNELFGSPKKVESPVMELPVAPSQAAPPLRPVLSLAVDPPQVVVPVATQTVVAPLAVDPTPVSSMEKGFQYAEFGDKVSRYPIERFKASVQKNERISTLSRHIVIVKIHYEKGLGAYYCFNGVCCNKNGLPSVRYIIPIIVYTTDMRGIVTGPNFEIKYLSIGQDLYNTLTVLDQNVRIDEIDFILTCTDEHFQKLTLQNVGPALWKKNPQYMALVMEKYRSLERYLFSCVARIIDEKTYMANMQPSAEISAVGESGVEAFDLSTFLQPQGK